MSTATETKKKTATILDRFSTLDEMGACPAFVKACLGAGYAADKIKTLKRFTDELPSRNRPSLKFVEGYLLDSGAVLYIVEVTENGRAFNIIHRVSGGGSCIHSGPFYQVRIDLASDHIEILRDRGMKKCKENRKAFATLGMTVSDDWSLLD